MRIKKLRLAMKSEDIELFVLQERQNISYFTGIESISGHLFVRQEGEPRFYVVDKQFQQALEESKSSGVNLVRGQPDYKDHLIHELGKEAQGITQVAFDTLDVANYKRLVETLKIEPILGSSMISSLQRFYDEEELKLVKKAASIADAGFEAVRETLRPGVTELEVIGQMQYTFRKKGSEWDTFRVSGSGLNSAYSESLPSNRVINRGDMVFIDIGPAYKGYMADVSRTFMVGKPNSEQRIILDNLVEIESKAISLAKAGVKSGDLDTKIRQLVTDKGFGDFLHHSGHALSQAFKIVPESATVLEAGDVICLEPGIYVPGVGGGRIEDEIIITRGAPELISHANRCPYVEV